MKDTTDHIETELGLDKSILVANFALGSLIQRFNEATKQETASCLDSPRTLPSGVVSQIIKLQESLEDMFQFRYPNCDPDVRAGLTFYGVEMLEEEAEENERLAQELRLTQELNYLAQFNP